MNTLNYLKQIAHGITKQFGQNCEIVIHDLRSKDLENTVAYIENGHVTNRQIGAGPSHVVLEASGKHAAKLQDRLGYLTRTQDGRILKSSTFYIRNDEEEIEYILSLNFDITGLMAVDNAINTILAIEEKEKDAKSPEKITQNVNDLLDDLIEQSVASIGKPVALMTKDEKVFAIQFLNDAGAFLITKSGDKVSNYFGISKYTLYSYIDINKGK